MGIRDFKNRARLTLHKGMSFPAIYVAPGVGGSQTACSIRISNRVKQFGDMTGIRYQPAEILETVPSVIALVGEISPMRGGYFSVAADEAYAVEVVMPPDGITVTSQVTRLNATQIAAAALPVPVPAP